MKENKNFELRATKKPAKNDTLSTTVAVYMGQKSYYCYISFSEKFVEAVGKKLPRGVSPQDPAYISVVHEKRDWGHESWAIRANYTTGVELVCLWTTPEQPSWINFYETKAPKIKAKEKS